MPPKSNPGAFLLQGSLLSLPVLAAAANTESHRVERGPQPTRRGRTLAEELGDVGTQVDRTIQTKDNGPTIASETVEIVAIWAVAGMAGATLLQEFDK